MGHKVRYWSGSKWESVVLPDVFPAVPGLDYDFNDTTNPAYGYPGGMTQAEKEALWFSFWPFASSLKPTIVDLISGSGNFRTDVINTLNAAGGPGTRVAVRLPAGTFHLTAFVPTGSDPTYAFGVWDPRLVGFIGAGVETIIKMDANSMSTAQLTKLATLTNSTLNNMDCMRIDGSPATPACNVGFRLIAADQQLLTSTAAGQGVVTPQPAPHGGVFYYKAGTASYSASYTAYVWAEGFGRASTAAPPFEHANFRSMNGYHHYVHVRSDGRASALVDAARPRRCGVLMTNSEQEVRVKYCHIDRCNVSRYAANSQNGSAAEVQEISFTKIEQISNTQNTDPVYGALGGYTNASCFGWETYNGQISVHDCLVSNDGTSSAGQVPAHFQFTYVSGGRADPGAGSFTAFNNTYKTTNPAWAHLDGFPIYRMVGGWYTAGPNNVIDDRPTPGAAKRIAYVYAGTWPPSAATLAAAGVTPSTHFLVRAS